LDNCPILLSAWAKKLQKNFCRKKLGDCSVIVNVWVKKFECKGKIGGRSIIMFF
jgi:hypothetical protein